MHDFDIGVTQALRERRREDGVHLHRGQPGNRLTQDIGILPE